MFSSNLIKGFLLILVVSIITSVSFIFASSNTGLNNKGGEGTGSISGYVVSNIEYELGVNPEILQEVKFTLDSPATTVRVNLVSSTSNYYPCTTVSGNQWSCLLTSLPVAVKDTDALRVIAIQ
jgi:hypothetical protein